MKIIDNLKMYNPEDEIEEVIANIEGFDFTELDIEEIGEAIKPALMERDNWLDFGRVEYISTGRFQTKIKELNDKNLYPTLLVEITVSLTGHFGQVYVELNPFECEDVRGSYIYARAIDKVSRAFKKFMKEKFGKAYVEANNNYWCAVKQNGVENVLNEATQQINKLNDEYNENVISL